MVSKKHFVLVHGAGHGAWCWYKLVPLLKSAGHQVSALDLGASGINPKQLDDLASFDDYVQPLMEFMSSLPQDERVILVGHSFGGVRVSTAMEKFPEKVLIAVFVTACMPDCIHRPATLITELFKWTPMESLVGCEISYAHGPESLPTSFSFGPDFLENMLYQKCQPEDVELGKKLVRPHGSFLDDLGKEALLTEGKYGSVNRAYVVCEEDIVMKEGFQKWMIASSPTNEVKFIEEAGHMVMLTNPLQLCQCLLDIVQKS